MSYTPAQFENRWVITGTLTTDTPLHIGGGETITRPGLVNEQGQRLVQVKAVFTDQRSRACLPGSSLRGVLRERLSALLGKPGQQKDEQPPLVMRLFGKPEPAVADERARRNQSGNGGHLAVHDALVVAEPFRPPAQWHPPAFWDAVRRTGVTSSVALNRRPRTAAAQKLFHAEFVPPGVSFVVKFTGDNLSKDGIAHLLRALEEFNPTATTRLTLGADTGNGWGRLLWKEGEVRHLDRMAVRQALPGWLSKPATLSPGASAAPLGSRLPTIDLAPPARPSFGPFELLLLFEGPFLVKRPAKPKAKGDTDTPNAQPLLDARGHVVLPASSFRGALRAQAERILRTLALAAHPNLLPGQLDRIAPDPTGTGETLRRVSGSGSPDSEGLSLAGRLLGVSGWRSPLDVTAFTEAGPDFARLEEQDFVAIDRFTGGGKDGAKFKFRAALCPSLTGQIALAFAPGSLAARVGPGLMALVLRDVLEGDVAFGMGAGKGYGACRGVSAGILAWQAEPGTAESLRALRDYVKSDEWKKE